MKKQNIPLTPEQLIQEREKISGIIITDKLINIINELLIRNGFAEDNNLINLKFSEEEWNNLVLKNLTCNDFELPNLDYIIVEYIDKIYRLHGWNVQYYVLNVLEFVPDSKSFDGKSLANVKYKFLLFNRKA